jgi:hypothetical protein
MPASSDDGQRLEIAENPDTTPMAFSALAPILFALTTPLGLFSSYLVLSGLLAPCRRMSTIRAAIRCSRSWRPPSPVASRARRRRMASER